jgi:hypothetical protein
VQRGGTNIKTVNAVGSPGCAVCRFFVDDNAHARGGEWSAVEVWGAVELVPGGNQRGAPGGAKQVEGHLGVRDKLIPGGQGKGGVAGAQSGDEMVLPGADGPLGTVGSMSAWRNVLRGNAELGVEGGESTRRLVVQTQEGGLETAGCEEVASVFVRGDKVGGLAGGQRYRFDIVGVFTKHDHDIFVARGGGVWEPAAKVDVVPMSELTSLAIFDGDRRRFAGGGRRGGVQFIGRLWRVVRALGRFSAAEALARLVKMSLGGGNGARGVLVDHCRGEAGKSVVAEFERLKPGGDPMVA